MITQPWVRHCGSRHSTSSYRDVGYILPFLTNFGFLSPRWCTPLLKSQNNGG
jgi:hypothetical protein